MTCAQVPPDARVREGERLQIRTEGRALSGRTQRTDVFRQTESTREKLGADKDYLRKPPIISKQTRQRTSRGREELPEKQPRAGEAMWRLGGRHHVRPGVDGRPSRAIQQPQRARFWTGTNLSDKQLNQFAPRKVSKWDMELLVFTR